MKEIIIKGFKTPEGRIVVMGVSGQVFNVLTGHLLNGLLVETILDADLPSPMETSQLSVKHPDEESWYMINYDGSFDVPGKLAKHPVWLSGAKQADFLDRVPGPIVIKEADVTNILNQLTGNGSLSGEEEK